MGEARAHTLSRKWFRTLLEHDGAEAFPIRGPVLILTLLLITPAATATWMGRGFAEPDTAYDKESGRMFENADTSTDANLHQVYFNAYATVDRTINPNLGTTGSAFLPAPLTFWAYLGTWKDCNGDGYIGQIEGALEEYRAELLLNDDICPARDHPATGNGIPSHNDGDWVREFLWIGPNAGTPYYVKDESALVWGDFGLPDANPIRQCQITPLWTGTLQSTGGMIRLVDCAMNERLVQTINTLANTTGQNELSFDDAPSDRPDQSDSTLNQANPYGQEGDAALITAFDCGAPITVRDPTAPDNERGELSTITLNDPTGGDLSGPQDLLLATVTLFDGDTHSATIALTDEKGAYLTAYTPMVPAINPNGSPAGTTNQTLEAIEDCDRNSGIGTESDLYGNVEGDFTAGTNQRKNADIYFRFVSENGRNTRTNVIVGEADPDTSPRKQILGETTPGSLGISLMPGNMGSYHWWGNPTTTASRNPYAWTDNPGPRPVQYHTFYANLETSVNNLKTPAPVPAIYGAPHCDGTTPITGTWSCNRADWGTDPTRGRVGDQYQMLDIDCYDEAATRDQPAHWGTISNTQCT